MNKPEILPSIYSEWQVASASSFIPHIIVYPSIWLVFAPINDSFGTWFGAVATALSLALRLALAKRIEVTQEVFRIGSAEIPREFIGTVQVIPPENQIREKGASLHARAFLAIKGLPGLVKVWNTDPNDPTPYLLISTRRPIEMQKALES